MTEIRQSIDAPLSKFLRARSRVSSDDLHQKRIPQLHSKLCAFAEKEKLLFWAQFKKERGKRKRKRREGKRD